MKLPNGYGTVYRLTGNRRRPYVAKKTINGHQVAIGYYATRAEGLQALAEYNRNPANLSLHTTFREVYELWSAAHFPRLRSESARVSYRNSFSHAARLHNMPFSAIRLHDLDAVMDDVRACGAGYPTQKKVRTLFSELYSYAIRYDLVSRDYSRYVTVDRPRKVHDKKPFTVRQRNRLWRGLDDMPQVRIVLMLLYTGCRIGEFLHVRQSDVSLRRRV